MKKADLLSTLFVGIDVSSRDNVVCAINFDTEKLLEFSVSNNQPGAVLMAEKLNAFLYGNKELNKLVIALESTSFYGIHIANYLSSCELLLPFHTKVYCLNPKMIANYKKSYLDLGKNDLIDAFVIADFARVGRITTTPWRGSQFLALQRLTRHRLHLAAALTREKTYMLSNIFLKFSELSILDEDKKPFASNYGATASSVLTDFLSTEDIANMPLEALIAHICEKGKNQFINPSHTACLLQQAARNSYRLDKCLYEPLTIAIASSFNLILAYESELKTINKAIEKTLKGLCPNEYQSLLSIPGVGLVYASGIIAEIGSIDAFDSHNALAKYAGLVWRENQSGNFRADDTKLSKAGNSYLRYYLIEAAHHVKDLVPEYKTFYQKKYDEVKTHQHKRALALTARKFIRLIFGLLANHQLYSKSRVSQI
jgi:transposase